MLVMQQKALFDVALLDVLEYALQCVAWRYATLAFSAALHNWVDAVTLFINRGAGRRCHGTHDDDGSLVDDASTCRPCMLALEPCGGGSSGSSSAQRGRLQDRRRREREVCHLPCVCSERCYQICSALFKLKFQRHIALSSLN